MPPTHDLTIERLAFGGAGVGHLDGKVCFVPYTAPGDVVRVTITADKRSYCEAKVIELLTPGAGRVVPPCPIAGVCGGCQWQHLDYQTQLNVKQELFVHALQKTARVPQELVAPPIPSPTPFGYRSRIQLKMRAPQGQLLYGFYRAGTHWVVPLPTVGCLLADERINRAITEIRAVFTEFPEPTVIPQLDLAVGDDGGVTAILHYLGDVPATIRDFIVVNRAAMPTLVGMAMQQGRKSTLCPVFGEEAISYALPEELGGFRMRVSQGGFSQVNLSQNRQLVRQVWQWLTPTAADRVLDLFCGNGNFSLPLARSGAILLGSDDFAGAIADARANAAAAALTSARFATEAAAATVQRLLVSGERLNAILLDPPRTGARELVDRLPDLGAERIVYVSCDPMTLARDLASLTRVHYVVQAAQPVDMFPQTYHLESATLLIRR